MQQVNERSTAYLTVTPKDKAGTAQAPTSLTWRIDDVFTSQEILADTVVSGPGSTVELTLKPEHNRILTAGSTAERRRVTVTAVYGIDDQVCGEYVYEVVNLNAVA
jgi:hypothetical protein